MCKVRNLCDGISFVFISINIILVDLTFSLHVLVWVRKSSLIKSN